MKAPSTSFMKAGCSPRWRRASNCRASIRRTTNPRRAMRSGASDPGSAFSQPMFFVLSKILGFFALPSNDILVLGLIGLALMYTRLARAGRWLVTGSIVLFAAFGLLPLGKALIEPLENRFPPWDAARGP